MSCREHMKGQRTRPEMGDGAGSGGGRGRREVGRFWVHFEGKADIVCHQIRCGRGWEVWGEVNYSEISQEQEGQEGNGPKTADHSIAQNPTGSS